MFFSISKIFWLAVILYVVWMVFRIIEKRKQQNIPKPSAKSGFFGFGRRKSEEADERPVDTRPCEVCQAFVSSAGCNRPECPVRQN